jgi:hypothetical protein
VGEGLLHLREQQLEIGDAFGPHGVEHQARGPGEGAGHDRRRAGHVPGCPADLPVWAGALAGRRPAGV